MRTCILGGVTDRQSSPGQRLQEAFETGVLVRPTRGQASLVDLIAAIGRLSGVNDVDSPSSERIAASIGQPDHLVFILLDGLGLNLVRRLPKESFLASHLRMDLRATCPSTTACALTSIATARHPSQHAVAGWFTYLPEYSLTAVVLPFAERMTNQPLVARGIRPQDVLPLPPILPRMTRHALTLVPALLSNTTYNVYSRGGTEGRGYHSIHNGIDQVISHVVTADGPTYTHLYLPEVDTICHKLGTEHDNVLPLVLQIDAELTRLHAAVGGRARIIVSADHGLIDVPASSQHFLLMGDPLLDLLVVPPTGDARMPIFHVKPDRHEAFVDAFCARFGESFVLLPTAQAEEMELFGPGPMSARARPRFGDFVGIAVRPATVAFHPPGKPLGHLYLGVHAGLSPEEMSVPLCIA